MLIVCPSCASEYTLDAARLGPEGRRLRCAGCRTTFHVLPPAPEAPTPDPVESGMSPTEDAAAPIRAAESDRIESVPPDAITVAAETRRPGGRRAAPRRPAKPRTEPRGPRLIPAAAALVLFALGGATSIVAARGPIVRHAPQTAGLFAALGFPVNLRGLALVDVTARQTSGEGGGYLVVEGDVTNPTRVGVPVPGLVVEVRDAHDEPVYRWTAEAPREALEPAESARFRARLAAPPAEGRRVLVRFADAAPHGDPPAEAPPVPRDAPAETKPPPPAAAHASAKPAH